MPEVNQKKSLFQVFLKQWATFSRLISLLMNIKSITQLRKNLLTILWSFLNSIRNLLFRIKMPVLLSISVPLSIFKTANTGTSWFHLSWKPFKIWNRRTFSQLCPNWSNLDFWTLKWFNSLSTFSESKFKFWQHQSLSSLQCFTPVKSLDQLLAVTPTLKRNLISFYQNTLNTLMQMNSLQYVMPQLAWSRKDSVKIYSSNLSSRSQCKKQTNGSKKMHSVWVI